MPDWKAVADKLAEKHGGTIVTVKDSVFSRLDTLKKMAPPLHGRRRAPGGNRPGAGE